MELAYSLAQICSLNCMCAAPVLHTSTVMPFFFFFALCHQLPLQDCIFLLFLHISLPFQSSGLHQSAIVRTREETRENRWRQAPYLARCALATRLSDSDDALLISTLALALRPVSLSLSFSESCWLSSSPLCSPLPSSPCSPFIVCHFHLL